MFNGEKFKDAIEKHVKDKDTKAIKGEYRRQKVTHHYNEKTKINVIKDEKGNYISNWKLDAQKEAILKQTGRLGGGKCTHYSLIMTKS